MKKILEIRDFLAESIKDKKFQFQKNDSFIFGLEISVANITENISIELEKDYFYEKSSLILICNKFLENKVELKELKAKKYMFLGRFEFHMNITELNFVKKEIKKFEFSEKFREIKFTPLCCKKRRFCQRIHNNFNKKSNFLISGKRFGGFTSRSLLSLLSIFYYS